jgi:hypothetical protein
MHQQSNVSVDKDVCWGLCLITSNASQTMLLNNCKVSYVYVCAYKIAMNMTYKYDIALGFNT